MGKKPKRTYSAEFRAEAVALVLEQGVALARAARDLGMSASTLTLWVQKAKAKRRASETLNESEAEELRRLRREVRILREERDILKKATAFFAKQDR